MSTEQEQPGTAAPPSTETRVPPWEAAWRALTPAQQRIHHAYHEAGHAVVAWHFGFPIRWVSIASIGSTGGRVRYAASLRTQDKRVQLATIEAGRVAVAFLYSRRGWDPALADKGTADDEDQAFDLAVAMRGANRHRTPEQTEGQWIEQVGMPALQELMNASEHARKVLAAPGYWHAIGRLAAALLDLTTVTGAQAKRLIEAALQERRQKGKAGHDPLD